MSESKPPLHLIFDPTPEIFATDNGGAFNFPLLVAGQAQTETEGYDELRLVVSLWHPAGKPTIDLDRAYVDFRLAPDPEENHWIQLAEVEPVVPAYRAGERFDGWIILPVLAQSSAFSVGGSGFQARTRLQIRASAYLVA